MDDPRPASRPIEFDRPADELPQRTLSGSQLGVDPAFLVPSFLVSSFLVSSFLVSSLFLVSSFLVSSALVSSGLRLVRIVLAKVFSPPRSAIGRAGPRKARRLHRRRRPLFKGFAADPVGPVDVLGTEWPTEPGLLQAVINTHRNRPSEIA